MNTRLSLRKKLCSICFENIDIKGELDNCKHQFCFECIKVWADKETSCPVCRSHFQKIKKSKCRINYCQKKHKQQNYEIVPVETKKQDSFLVSASDIIPFMIELFSLIGQEEGTLIFQ